MNNPRAYAEVVVNLPLVSGIFSYAVPPDLEAEVLPGCLVTAPFNNTQVQGIVLRRLSQADIDFNLNKIKSITALLDNRRVVNDAQIQLGHWMARQTLSPLATCFSPMLPPGLSQQADTLYHLNLPLQEIESAAKNQTQLRLLRLLQERGDLHGRQIEKALPRQAWKAAANTLVKSGAVTSRPVLQPPTTRAKTVRTAQLIVTPAQAEASMDGLGRAGTPALQRRQAMLRFLMKNPLPVELTWVYAASGASLADARKLEEMQLVALGENETWRDPLEKINVAPSGPPQLTDDQQKALQEVREAIEQLAQPQQSLVPQPFLLHGITGSGKTEIYLHAVAETLAKGRGAIVLVPEISLTPQTVRRFMARFPGKVGLIHSRLSSGERYDTWRRIREGTLTVVIGPRSALFAPMSNLGLIVIDECHDGSYSQEDSLPYYHAVDTAIAYGRMTRSVVILGSATPDMELYHCAQQQHWSILRLPLRILAHRQAVDAQRAQLGLPPLVQPTESMQGERLSLELPPVEIVDMRQELKQGNRTIFSRLLQNKLQETLANHHQAILFLNRRGTATYVFCRDCGFTLKCPRCDLPLTFHQGENGLICHTCNYRRQLPKLCPQCSSPHIRQFGIGTEKVEEEVRALHPTARVIRYDYETTRQKGAHDVLLQTFSEHRADILVGTQMLAKGLDLPLVTLVGVMLADVGLQMPDYNASERGFQLLAQVAGRAGRSALGGKVVFQTFMPDHYAIRAAAGHDYAGFYRQEIAYRKKMNYPPFSKFVRLEFRHPDPARAEAEANLMAQRIKLWSQDDNALSGLIGPAPCFFGKQNGIYRWQIILRGRDPVSILRDKPLGEWRIEVSPTSLL